MAHRATTLALALLFTLAPLSDARILHTGDGFPSNRLPTELTSPVAELTTDIITSGLRVSSEYPELESPLTPEIASLDTTAVKEDSERAQAADFQVSPIFPDRESPLTPEVSSFDAAGVKEKVERARAATATTSSVDAAGKFTELLNITVADFNGTVKVNVAAPLVVGSNVAESTFTVTATRHPLKIPRKARLSAVEWDPVSSVVSPRRVIIPTSVVLNSLRMQCHGDAC